MYIFVGNKWNCRCENAYENLDSPERISLGDSYKERKMCPSATGEICT